MSRNLQWMGNAILILSVLLLAAVLVVPRFTGLALEPVLSGSMEPNIHTGALIGITRTDPAQVAVGDIIGFHVAGMDTPVCHRVIEIVQTNTGYAFKTMGDANNDPDPWIVNPQDLIGKVNFNLAWLGYAAKYFKTPTGFLLMMGIPATLVVLLELKGLFMPTQKKRKRPNLHKKPFNILPFIPFIGGTALVLILWAVMAGNITEKTLSSLSPADTGEGGYTAQRTIQNKGKLPLIICLTASDPGVVFSENSFELSPGAQKRVEIKGENGDSVINSGGFFPILPAETLKMFFDWNPLFSSMVAVGLWIIPLTLIAFLSLELIVRKAPYRARTKYFRGALSNE
jgi:signal peptidase